MADDKNPLISSAGSDDDLTAITKLGDSRTRLKAEIGKVIIGQEHVVDDLLTAMFSRGHCLMIGVPGLAKTLMVSTIARAIDLSPARAAESGRGEGEGGNAWGAIV